MGEKKQTVIGARLQRLREDKGLTQAELSERSGIPYQRISEIERGDTADPRASTLRTLALALGRPPGDLLSDPLDPLALATIEEFLSGPLAARLAVTKEERKWLLNEVPAAFWVTLPPSDIMLMTLIQNYRADKK